MKKSSRKLNVIVVGMAAFIVLTSTLITIYTPSFIVELTGFGGGRESGGYQNITFTDAVMACNEATEDRYGDRIRNLEVDNHSSRYDNKTYLYKIFMNMDMYEKKGELTQAHFVNCFVRASNGSIKKYDVFENEGRKEKGIDSYGTNLFGMPKKN